MPQKRQYPHFSIANFRTYVLLKQAFQTSFASFSACPCEYLLQSNGTIIDSRPALTLLECQAYCRANDFCCAFSFHRMSRSCYLYTDDFVKGPPNVEWNYTFNNLYYTAAADCANVDDCVIVTTTSTTSTTQP